MTKIFLVKRYGVFFNNTTVEGEEPVIYRLGSISMEEIQEVVGAVALKNKKEQAPDAPGMLSRHYAPETPTYWVNDVNAFVEQYPAQRIGLILFSATVNASPRRICKYLSGTEDLKEATANLYAIMHELDKLDLDMIVAERLPDYGLGRSLNDRLQRATKKK